MIAFGGGGPAGGNPDTRMFRDRIKEMEAALPVDGVLISANPTVDGQYIYYPDAWFGAREFRLEDFRQQIADLKATKTTRFTDNYVRLNVNPGDVSWFDDVGWKAILNNANVAATVTREGKLKGIFFDTEQYNQETVPFDYATQNRKEKRSFKELSGKVFRRGQQLGNAFAKTHPGMKLLLTYSTSFVAYDVGVGVKGQLPLTASQMSLLPAFVDGLLAADRLTVVDAYERSYPFKTHAQFKGGRDEIKQRGKALSRDPKRYARLQAGFGVWLAQTERADKFERSGFWGNHFTPEELEHSLSHALEQSDGTIWLYMGGLSVFGNDTLPVEYREAILRAKQPHDPNWQPRLDTNPSRALVSEPPDRLVFEAEDMNPTLVEGKEGLDIPDSAIGHQQWGQHGKMVVVLGGMFTTGTVRFTFPQAIPDGMYRLRVRIVTPPNQNDTHIRWRSLPSPAIAGEGVRRTDGGANGGWTTVQFGDKSKGTELGYAQWTWLEMFGPGQPYRPEGWSWLKFERVAAGQYAIEIQDDDPATYNMVWIDQFELVRRKEPKDMKVITFGGFPGTPSGGMPDPGYLQTHLAAMEALPFDGLVFNISNRVGYFADEALGRKPFTYSDIEADVKVMKSLPFRKLTENYLRLDIAPVDYDWFDDVAWKRASEGFRMSARAAKESGVAGIMFDTEQYGPQPFNYMLQAKRAERSFDDYCAQARRRGREAMQAMRSEFPGLRLMMTFGPSSAFDAARKAPLFVTGFGLLPAFFDGMLEAAKDEVIIDAFEGAYGYRKAEQYVRARALIRDEAANLSKTREAYRSRMKVGFGVWPSGSEKLLADDFTKNAFTPEELEHALCYAREQSDGTIWVYGGGINWFNCPKEYLSAIEASRQPHDYLFQPWKRPGEDQQQGYIISAKGRPDTADEVVFASLRSKHKELYDFPKVWRFRLDPKEAGVREKWFAPDLDESLWRNLEISEWWEPQLQHIYFGYAWYRFSLDAPADWAGKKLLLAFGAVDEQAWVYLNGEKIGEHAYGPEGWNSPFEFGVAGKLKPGQR
ncbi:MAG: hypothetical protein HY318_16865, partial [Armatimonadetes bacterium]|nr:hypothetical protein [Armatimonadota bacterium]